jgi:hypothetical protein
VNQEDNVNQDGLAGQLRRLTDQQRTITAELESLSERYLDQQPDEMPSEAREALLALLDMQKETSRVGLELLNTVLQAP